MGGKGLKEAEGWAETEGGKVIPFQRLKKQNPSGTTFFLVFFFTISFPAELYVTSMDTQLGWFWHSKLS